MKIFLPPMTSELGRKFERMIDLALPESKAIEADLTVRWSPEFFGVKQSRFWQELSSQNQERFLFENSQELLTEALLIEHAGVAYGHHMALHAETQQERHYYTSIATEELQHLRWLKPYTAWTPAQGIPSFPQMIADLILKEERSTLFLMIQVLLEGWGIHYYSSLMQGTDHVGIQKIFANILFDESRHHAGGLLLFEEIQNKDLKPVLPKIQGLLDSLRIGPYRVALSLGTLSQVEQLGSWTELFESLNASEVAEEKLQILRRILGKALSQDLIEELDWQPFTEAQMAGFLFSQLGFSENPNPASDNDL